jgi:phosphoserine phosphatase
MFQQKRLIIFDVDGVLLNNERGGFKDILVLLGKQKEVQWIDEEYQRRKDFGPWGLEELAALYSGFSRLELEKTAKEYCQKNLMLGAEQTVKSLKEKGYLVGAISSNPQFIMDILVQMLGLDFAYGTELEFQNDLAAGRIFRKVDRNIKAEILQDKIKALNLDKNNVIIIGDSITDLAIAGKAGLFIGFNVKKEIEDRADVVVKGKDLREILIHVD